MKTKPYTRERGVDKENTNMIKLFGHVMRLVSDRMEMPFLVCNGDPFRYNISARNKEQTLEEQRRAQNNIVWHIEIEYFERHKMAQLWFMNLKTTETHMVEIPFKGLSEFATSIMDAIKLWKEGKIKEVAKISRFAIEL